MSARYHLWARYANQTMMGHGLGQVQIIRHDGRGHIEIETRPFAVMNVGAYVDLGWLEVKPDAG